MPTRPVSRPSGRLIVRVLAVLLAAGGFVSVTATPALACSVSTHCYGEAQQGSSSVRGVYADITPSCLSTPSGNFVTDEVWLATSDGKYWVEVGYLQHGGNLNVGGLNTKGRYAFWADQRPNHAFYLHVFGTNPSLSAGAVVEVSYTSSQTYFVNFNSYTSNSTSNTMASNFGEYGSETTSASSKSYSTVTNVEWEDGSGWYSGLSSPGTVADSPQKFSWIKQYSSYHAGITC